MRGQPGGLRDAALLALFTAAIAAHPSPKTVAKWVINEVRRVSKGAAKELPFDGNALGELVAMLMSGEARHGDMVPFKKGGIAVLAGAATPGGMVLRALLPPVPLPPAPAAPAPAPASAPASAAAAPAPAKLKVAFAYVGPVGDGGWTFAHDNARKALEKELGDKIETSFVENVPEAADAERVFRDMVGQGNKLIFGTTFGYMEPMLKVAADSKDVKFEHATGYKQAENMRTYDSRTYEGAYMAGVIAGKMTKTNTLGVVGSIPIPEVIRNINSFTLGAQSVNPKVKTKVVWVNEWFNPPKETEAATALINGGADVLMQNTDSPAVLKTAQEKGKRAFGWDSDMTAYGPKAHLGSAVINWGPYYVKATRDALEGHWASGRSW